MVGVAMRPGGPDRMVGLRGSWGSVLRGVARVKGEGSRTAGSKHVVSKQKKCMIERHCGNGMWWLCDGAITLT